MAPDRSRDVPEFPVINQPFEHGLVAAQELSSGSAPRESSTYADWTDLDLVNAVDQGQEGAFAELYRRHQNSVAVSSRMVLGNGPESDDVTAEVFLGLWLHPAKFDGSRGSLLTYLRLQAKGRSIDLIRAEAARSRREKRDLQRRHPRDEEVGALVASSEAGAELRESMVFLAAPEREAIELAYFGGLTYAEVARQLELAEGTVKSRIRRGLEHLRALMSVPGSITVAERKTSHIEAEVS